MKGEGSSVQFDAIEIHGVGRHKKMITSHFPRRCSLVTLTIAAIITTSHIHFISSFTSTTTSTNIPTFLRLQHSSLSTISSDTPLNNPTNQNNILQKRNILPILSQQRPKTSLAFSPSSCSAATSSHSSSPSPSLLLSASSSLEEDSQGGEDSSLEFVKADDGEALQALFEQVSDENGLMTKETLMSIPIIDDLLSAGDLLIEELNDIWDAAPKFPDVTKSLVERIDVDSFIQVYRDIDDIFEEDYEDMDSNVTNDSSDTQLVNGSSETDPNNAKEVTNINGNNNNDDEDDDDDDSETAKDEQELEISFKTICDENQLVSRDAVRNWSEITELIDDEMLSEEEFNDMWEKTDKSLGSADMLDVDGFLSFNVALDDLFEFDGDDDDDDEDNLEGDEIGDIVSESDDSSGEEKSLFYADDLPPGVIFSELADDDYLIGMKELKQWGDLQDMLNDGDLLPIELQNIFDGVPKAPGTTNKINEDGFTTLFEAIDALFEDDNDGEEEEEEKTPEINTKSLLLKILSILDEDEEKLPCGLECTDAEIERVLNTVQILEKDDSNKVISSGGDIVMDDISGNWEMVFTSSSTLKFNKGLSGLVPPNGKFGGLVQTLKASKYLADVEYVESINAGPASFDVRVTGDWELRNSVSLFTGERSVALSVEPDKVSYGITSTRADHWKSLGPMNLLDITYLDDDLRIMRGTTSTDTIFIFRKI